MSSKDLAYQMTIYDWELFNCVHEVSRLIESVSRYTAIPTDAAGIAQLQMLMLAAMWKPHDRCFNTQFINKACHKVFEC